MPARHLVGHRDGALLVEEAHLNIMPPLVVLTEFSQACTTQATDAVDHNLRFKPWHQSVGYGTLGDVGAPLGTQLYTVGGNQHFHPGTDKAVAAFRDD